MMELPEPEHHLELPATTGEPFESPTAQPLVGETYDDLAMRMLYEEQVRLRAEVAKMKDKGEDGGDDKKDGDKDDKKEEKKPPLTKRVGAWIKHHPIATALILLAVILLILLLIWLIYYLDSYASTDDAFIDGHTDPISARIEGHVTNVYVEDTWRVKKGQLLVILDPHDNEAAKEQAIAKYAQARASTQAEEPNLPVTVTNQSTQVVNTDFQIVNAEAQVAAAQERSNASIADLRQAEAQHANAVREAERYRQLVEKEEVSREQYDQRATEERSQAAVVNSRREQAEASEKTVTQARAQLGQARQQHEQAQKNLPQQIAMQKATLAERKAAEFAAKAQVDQAELNFQYTRIYAPEDGIIGDKQVQVATQVSAGQELFALTQTNNIWVTANFKETAIARMRPGQSVTIHVDALDADFQGYIQSMPGASGAVYSLLPPENATGNYVKVVQRLSIRIGIKPGQNGLDRLAPGMSVEPKVWLR